MVVNRIIDEDTEQIIKENDGLKELQDCTVMVTGASGMVGSYIIYTLIKLNEDYGRNINIVPLVRNVKKLNSTILSKSYVNPIVQDVTSPIKCPWDVDYIIHAASPASPKIMKEKPLETNFANTIGTANTIKYALEIGAKGYAYISSREIYGQPAEGQEFFTEYGPLGQVDPLVPRNGYAEGKKAAENMCAAAKAEYDLNTKIIRLAHTYGPGMTIDDGRVQADFLRNVVRNENILLHSDGSSVRTYTYISDAVSAMFWVLLKSKDVVYNIANEKDKTSVRQLAETLVSIYPERGLELVFDIPKQNVNQGTAAFTLGILSTDKLISERGVEPKYNMHDGFARTLDYLENFDTKAIEERKEALSKDKSNVLMKK
jgi:nucleoside-diphosphate-sugar epimerase